MYDCDYNCTPFVGWVGIMPLGCGFGPGDFDLPGDPIDP